MKRNDSIKKIHSRTSLHKVLKDLKKKGKKIVFTNGCFDILHLGHIKLIKKAKSMGDVLVAGINSDSSVKKLKGPKRPVMKESARAEIIASLEPVDYVTVFREDTPFELIKFIQPDILVKGGDYGIKEIVGRGIVKKVVRFKTVKGFSTTFLLKKIS